MKLIGGKQIGDVEDPVRAKLAIVIPVLKATLHSLARDRTERLGGMANITLHDLAREYRQGHGDAGICFEYAVHEAIASHNALIQPLASEVLESLCRIRGGAESILFGPEKEGVIPIIESVTNALTDESVVYVGNAGRPPKLRRYIPRIVRAYRRNEEQNRLPRSITGLWKADLFLGNHLRVLHHHEQVTRNVSQTCRFFGISRSLFYVWRDRYRQDGLVGLRDGPRG